MTRFHRNQKWNLLYRGTRDGFDLVDYTEKVKFLINTLTIIKTTNGNIFGGFNNKNNMCCFVFNPKSFLFSLINKENKPFISTNQGANNSQSCPFPMFFSKYCEPYDDCKHEIVISANSNTNTNSSCNFGNSFKHSDYPHGSEREKSILAGYHKFQTVEIEVFYKVPYY